MSTLGNQSEDVKMRGIAAEALADLRDEQAVPVLIAALGDAAVEVRFCATFALGELGISGPCRPSGGWLLRTKLRILTTKSSARS